MDQKKGCIPWNKGLIIKDHILQRLEKNQKIIKRRIEEKILVMNHYTNSKNKCSCCQEDDISVLTIDHINGGGRQHGKEIGSHIYYWLIKNNFPEGYQVLCMNCNSVKEWKGSCEHRKNKYNIKE